MKKTLVTILAASAVCLSALSAETYSLSLEDAVESAVKNNISIQQSDIALKSKKRSSKYSWNSISPSISGSGSYSVAAPNENDAKAQISFGANFSANFSPSLFTSIKNAKLSYELQQITYETAVQTVELNVRKSYYSLLAEIEKIKLQEKSLETSRKQYEANLAKYNSGKLSRLDVLSAQVSYQNAELNIKSLKSDHENNVASFKQVLGISQSDEIQLTGSFEPILSLKEVSLEGIQKKSPKVASLEKQIQAAKNSILASRFSAWGPSLSARYSYTYSSRDGGENFDDGGTLTFGVSIPVDGFLPWSSGAMNIAAQKDNLANLELSLEDAKTTVEVSTKDYIRKIQQCQANLKQRKYSIELAQSTYEMTLEAYNHGTKDLLSLQSSLDSLLSARVNLLVEAFSLASAVLDLESTLGIEFGTLGK